MEVQSWLVRKHSSIPKILETLLATATCSHCSRVGRVGQCLMQVYGLRQKVLGSQRLTVEVLQKCAGTCRSKNVEVLCCVLT